MKNTSLSRLVWALFLVGMCSVPAQSADSARVGAYDFSYFLSGDARAKPVQVFDDGRNTYFQFRAGEAVPAIFSARNGVPQLLVPTQEGPYVRVAEMHGRFVLQVGRAQANVVHGGAEPRVDAPPITSIAGNGMAHPYAGGAAPAGGRLVASLEPVPMDLGPAQAVNRNSYATPVKGDKVFWPERTTQVEHSVGFARSAWVLSREALRSVNRIAQDAAPTARFTVIGRDDDSYKEGLERARADAIRSALMKAGIAPERITVQTGVMKAGDEGPLWDSTVVVQTSQTAPPMHLAPAAPAPVAASNPAVADNIVALVRSGVLNEAQAQALLARYRPAAAPAPQPVAPPRSFAMRKTDESIERMLQRWAKDSGWKLVWQSAPSIRITGDAEVDRTDFLQAADLVVKQVNAAGYHVKATAYSNNVLQIVGE